MTRPVHVALLGATLALAAPVRAQQPSEPDTSEVLLLDELVVTADRTESALGASVAAVTRVSPLALARQPSISLADALRLVPGVTLVDFDGLGHDPQTMVRGFYGGGEADYVVVMLDGKPLNDLQAGRMSWDLVPAVAIEAVEVVRGGSSALYGDAALGGVVNLISATDAPEGGYWDLSAGDFRSFEGSVRWSGRFATRPLVLYGGARTTEGFREHAQRRVASAGGRLALVGTESTSLALNTMWAWRTTQAPGPLPADSLVTGRRQSEPFHRYDGTADLTVRAGLDGERALGRRSTLSASVAGDVRRAVTAGTIRLALDDADTKERRLATERLSASLQLRADDVALPWRNRLIVGVDASAGHVESEYYEVQSGGRAQYVFGVVDTLRRSAGVAGGRTAAATFVQYDLWPTDALRLSVGTRLDWLSDDFEPTGPSTLPLMAAEHTALSPKAGANLRWIESARHTGHVYLTAGRSFKAPTPDQLFDQRTIPVPFFPFELPLSNGSLEPQRGTSLEAGAYHAVVLSPGAWTAGASLAAYRMDMEDEIDFDVATLSYGNITESRHQGVEAGVTFSGPLASALSLEYALQDVTSRSGANAGMALKAIPKHTLSGGAAARLAGMLEGSLRITRHGSAWLDDANTVRLPGFTRVDARASVTAYETEFSLELINLLDATYSTTGFLDPGGSGTAYYHPAAGRVMRLGVRVGV